MRKLHFMSLVLMLALTGPAMAQSVADDNLIVPGKRIGSVAIGMTLQQVYAALGDPSQQQRLRDGVIYSWGGPLQGEYRGGLGLDVFIPNDRDTVRWVVTNNPKYQLPGGVGVDSTAMRVRAILGTPTKDDILRPPNGTPPGTIPSFENMWYGRRDLLVTVNLSTGRVQAVKVWPPD